MKAHICRRYGGPEVTELLDVPKPVPNDDEVLIKILATTVTAGDWRVRTLEVPKGFGVLARLALGLRRPRQPILGTELAGVIEAVGSQVSKFKLGDAVFAFPGAKMGCHAQYRAVGQDSPVALKPENLSFDEAASLPFGGMTALHFLRKAHIKSGEKILVIGASGSVGSAMIQLAKYFGAEVTGVTSTSNLELVASLGAGRVIDYTKQKYLEDGQTYDIIADAVGATSFSRCKNSLREKGRLLAIAGGILDWIATLWAPWTGSKKVLAGPAAERPEYFRQIAELAKAGVLRPVIDRRYEFAQMAEAHTYVQTRRKKGSVVVRVQHNS